VKCIWYWANIISGSQNCRASLWRPGTASKAPALPWIWVFFPYNPLHIMGSKDDWFYILYTDEYPPNEWYVKGTLLEVQKWEKMAQEKVNISNSCGGMITPSSLHMVTKEELFMCHRCSHHWSTIKSPIQHRTLYWQGQMNHLPQNSYCIILDPIFEFLNRSYFTAEVLRCKPDIALVILSLECLIWMLADLLGRGM
jgi:hypothetical protein